MTIDEAAKLRGATYLPAKASTAIEMWQGYDRAIIERDLTYASKLKLNTLRIFLSYDYWLKARERLENSLYHLLHAASAHKIRMMPVMFDCTQKQGRFEDPSKWTAMEDYINWFMQRWSHEPRVLALDVIHQPRSTNEFKFARQMFRRASRHRKILPMTFSPRRLEDALLMLDLGLDLLQFRQQQGGDDEDLQQQIDQAKQTQEILGRPVLLTEWNSPYAVFAPTVQSATIGNFISSLMLHEREDGSVAGVFHENGAVWNLADARAISGDESFSAEERPRL